MPALIELSICNREMDSIQANWNDLPELPFEKILGHLSLFERIKCRSVSRSWFKKINSFGQKSLCFSEQSSGFIYQKAKWVGGAFKRNFISSSRFKSFIQVFGHSIFSSLKHLRLCDLNLNAENGPSFAQALNLLDQLEELDIIRLDCLYDGCKLNREFELNLPMLNSLQLEEVEGIHRLTLDAPELQNVKNQGFYGFLDLAHVESVERLVIKSKFMKVETLKSLKYLYLDESFFSDISFISDLEQLKEIHIFNLLHLWNLFRQKKPDDLKIFYRGCLLIEPNDKAIRSLVSVYRRYFAFLADHCYRLADQIPFCGSLAYETIGSVPVGLEIFILNRFTNLNAFIVSRPVQDIECFLTILKNCKQIVSLQFECDQQQALFDRLPDCCAVQKLTISGEPADFRFLRRLNHLIEIDLESKISVELIRDALKELKFLLKLRFHFKGLPNQVAIEVEHHPKRFRVWVEDRAVQPNKIYAKLFLKEPPSKIEFSGSAHVCAATIGRRSAGYQ